MNILKSINNLAISTRFFHVSTFKYKNLTREEATEHILNAKNKININFEQIAKQLGRDKVWLTAAILGQHSFTKQEAESLLKTIKLTDHAQVKELIDLLQEKPFRGFQGSKQLNDPTILRLYEIVNVYGPAIKLLINEMTNSDGIMSAIDCQICIDNYKDSNGNTRIKLIIDGKFLEYKKW